MQFVTKEFALSKCLNKCSRSTPFDYDRETDSFKVKVEILDDVPRTHDLLRFGKYNPYQHTVIETYFYIVKI